MATESDIFDCKLMTSYFFLGGGSISVVISAVTKDGLKSNRHCRHRLAFHRHSLILMGGKRQCLSLALARHSGHPSTISYSIHCMKWRLQVLAS